MLECSTAQSVRLKGYRGAPPVEIDFANPFHPREDVIHGLAARPNQISANYLWHEVAWHFQNLSDRGMLQPTAKNRGHRSSQRLHLGTQRYSKHSPIFVAYLEKDTDGISAFFIFPDILEVKSFTLFGLPSSGLVSVRNQRVTFFLIGQGFKETDDRLQALWIDRLSFALRVPDSVLHIY